MDVTDFDNRSSVRRLVSLVVAGMIVSLVVGATSARAQNPTPSDPASIVVFKLEGDAGSDTLRTELTSAMRGQVDDNTRYELVNDNPVVLSDVVVVLGCDSASTTCLGKAAEHFGADYLIFGKFEDAGGRNRVSVRLFDPSRGRYVRSFGRVLEKLSPPYQSFRDEVDALLRTDEQRQREQERQREEKEQTTTSLRVSANVEEAKVRLDGELVGETPLEREGISPGEYRVEVSKSGFETWKTVIQLEEGNNVDLQATIEEKPEPESEPQASASTSPPSSSGESGPADEMEPADAPPSAQKAKAATWGPWVSIGIGGATFIGASIQAARVNNLENNLRGLREESPRPDDFESREQDLLQKGKNAELSQWILIGVGSVTTTGGLLWLLFENTGGQGGEVAAEGRRLHISFTGTGIQANWRW